MFHIENKYSIIKEIRINSSKNALIIYKFVRNSILKKIIFFISLNAFFVLQSVALFAAPYNMCTGKEFNERVKMFLSGGDRNWDKDYTITIFERGYNPPDDKAYYVDISEDKDGTVIAYAKDNELYYYSAGEVIINKDCSYMFDKFIRMRNIDLTGFVYLGLNDTRYMFASCHHLKTIKFKKDRSAKKKVKELGYTLSEMQGMFFDCQSLVNIDLSAFDTDHVYNMDEVFYKCYNLKNIYVDSAKWKVENLYSCKRMFSLCHMLKTNFGRKAVDIASDNYEQYAIAGTGKDVLGKDAKEGLLKDVNIEYEDYGERDGSAPIDDDHYTVDKTAPIMVYEDEPEGDGGNGSGDIGTGSGDAGTGGGSLIGDKTTGYYAEKEQQVAEQVIGPTTGLSPIQMLENNKNAEQAITEQTITEQTTAEQAITEQTITEQTINEQIDINESETAIVTDIETTNERIDVIQETENVATEIKITDETEKNVEDNIAPIIEEEKSPKIMELDDYLRSQGLNGGGDNQGVRKGNDYQFLIFALFISSIAILLLIGMVVFLFKDKKENKDVMDGKT